MRALALCLTALSTFAGCTRTESPAPPVQRAFYAWRTTLEFSTREREALTALGVTRLYVRAFDVALAKDGTPQVTAPVTVSGPWPDGIELVPVVFLREAVFHAPGSEALAPLVWRDVEAIARSVRPQELRELQLDCDWADRSRAGYFAFLEAVGALARARGVELSATIRLHQIKYRERTGVPPVARGMMMFYNMGELGGPPRAVGTSIYDPIAASKYLERIPEYPLPLDLALPIWSWTLHLRDGDVEGLLQSTDPSELDGLPWLRAQGTDREATETTFFRGHLVRSGDVLRAEVTRPEDTRAALALVAPRLPPLTSGAARRTVTLFDLSERNLTRHDLPSLDQLFRAAR